MRQPAGIHLPAGERAADDLTVWSIHQLPVNVGKPQVPTEHSQNSARQAGAFELRGTAPGGRFGNPDWRIARRFHGLPLQPFNALTTQ